VKTERPTEQFEPGLILLQVSPDTQRAFAIDRYGKVYQVRQGSRVKDPAVVQAVQEAARRGIVQAQEQDAVVAARVEERVETIAERLAAEAARARHEADGARLVGFEEVAPHDIEVPLQPGERRTASGLIVPEE